MGVVFITWGVWLVGGAFVPEGPSKKLAPMKSSYGIKHCSTGSPDLACDTLVSVLHSLC